MQATSQPRSEAMPSSMLRGMIVVPMTKTPRQIWIRKIGWCALTTRVFRCHRTHAANRSDAQTTIPESASPKPRMPPSWFISGAGVTRAATSNVASLPTHPGFIPPSSTPNETVPWAVPTSRRDDLTANSSATASPGSSGVGGAPTTSEVAFIELSAVNSIQEGMALGIKETGNTSRLTRTTRPLTEVAELPLSVWRERISSEKATLEACGHGMHASFSSAQNVCGGHESAV
mmetsp:Transcript_29779/g.55382  ORF Transcript_29779/g.55382 Transcript_29779/m.55382 type:complete len:232 (-) Transcript_29779:65-760(-)